MSPTGTGVEEVAIACQRAGLFTTQSLSRFKSITLLVVRDSGKQTTYLITPDNDASAKTAALFASAIGATAHEDEPPVDVLEKASSVRQLRFQSFSGTFRETQQGSDPAEQARMLASAMSDGQWLAITLRRPGKFEHRRHARWLKERMATFLPTHHSLTSDTVIASFYVGSNSDADSNSLLLQVSETMPGFDIPVRTSRPVKRTTWMLAWMLAAVTVWAAGALPSDVSSALASSLGDIPLLRALAAVPAAVSSLLALPLVIAGYAVGRGWIRTADSQLDDAVRTGKFPAPPRYEIWRGKWTPPTAGKTDEDGRNVGMRQGNYPLSKRAFILGPHMPVLLTAPHAGAESGQRLTSSRVVPPALRTRIGPYIGKDEFGNPAYLPSTDVGSGVFVTGRRGSGKACALTTRIPTPTGWTTMGDLELGDEVYDSHGKPCRITYLSPINPNPNMFRVTFADGQTVLADWNHQWAVIDAPSDEVLEDRRHLIARSAARLNLIAHRSGPQEFATAEDILHLLRHSSWSPAWRTSDGIKASLDMTDAAQDARGRYDLALACRLLRTRLEQQLGGDGSGPLPLQTFVMSTGELLDYRDDVTRFAVRGVDRNGTFRTLHIDHIEPTTPVPARCITVDSPDSTYMVEDFIPTHNTQLLHGLFAWHCLDKVRPCGLPGSLGRNQTIIAFESKGEGATKYTQWAADVGDHATLIEVADADGWAIDLLDVPGSWNDRGLFLADMLKYVFNSDTDKSVGPSSYMALASFATAALALTESEEGRVAIKETQGVSDDASLMEILYILVGGRGDELAVNLDATINNQIKRLQKEQKDSEALIVARDALRPYYAGNPASSRRDAVSPPRNKVFQLLSVEHWWSGARKTVTWDRILLSQQTVVVNTGPVTNTRSQHHTQTLPDQIAKFMSGMLMYSLQKAIIRKCATWGAEGRGVSIFADELAQLAGDDPEVITWLHDQGRSFGVRSFFATQRSTQLDNKVRESVADYATTIYFRQADGNAAAPIAADLAADGTPWTIADLVSLQRFHAASRTTLNDERLTPFTFRAHNFAAHPEQFAEVQGWNDTPIDTDDDWGD